MSANQALAAAMVRMQGIFQKKPALAQNKAVMRARIVEGQRCELQEGDWRLSADMPVEAGGSGGGPNPGVYGRAALASCLTMGYAAFLVRAGLTWRSIEVEVQTDIDQRGRLGMDGVYPGYQRVQHTLYIDSDAPQESLRRAIEDSRRCSPYLHVFTDALAVTGEVVYAARPV